ncbi:MAG: pyruvate ferredoxin oxidoreductase [Armatimonadota bacterium]|nr:MAG: pyruvate ferredoxin oxidoreductase [Armatimonadota bacterium]
MEKTLRALTGNEAAAEAMRQINPDVVAAYPITPQTEIVQLYSGFVADGIVDTETVAVESEHSSMSATIGASAAGARAMTATSSQGLALMWEMLYIASGLRLPIVMPMVNRTLSAPLNIHCDHSDSMGARDSGWIQIYAEDSQEVYDSLIQAPRIAEHPEILLPTMVCLDGFILSHAMMGVELYPDEEVRDFVGIYEPEYALLNKAQPITMGAIDMFDYYFEHKRAHAEAMRTCKPRIQAVFDEFAERFGTQYGLIEPYRLDDAEHVVVVLGSTAGTVRVVVDELRERGEAVGMLKLRVFRPFPAEELIDTLAHVRGIAVLDRAEGMAGLGGPVYGEIRSALYDLDPRPVVTGYVYGLGGRDIRVEDIEAVFDELKGDVKAGRKDQRCRYIGVRE